MQISDLFFPTPYYVLMDRISPIGPGVVLDASGPCAHYIHAATMEAVLHAQENRTTHMTPTHHLTFTPETSAYLLEEMLE